MRWFLGAHRVTDSKLQRRTATMDEALAAAIRGTKKWLQSNPGDRKHYKETLLPAASALKGPKHRRGPAPKVILEPFSTYHFNCIVANPYAQVWQCVSLPEEKRPVGRRRSDGKAARQAAFRHALWECAVLIGEEPVRNDDGTIRVFHLWQEADEFALDLYENAPEDEVITWKPPLPNKPSVVNATMNHEVRFWPWLNGEKRPFDIWNVPYQRTIKRDITKPAVGAGEGGGSIHHLQETNPQLYLEIQEARRKERAENRVPAFSESPLLFRSIWEATKEAERRDAMMRGESV